MKSRHILLESSGDGVLAIIVSVQAVEVQEEVIIAYPLHLWRILKRQGSLWTVGAAVVICFARQLLCSEECYVERDRLVLACGVEWESNKYKDIMDVGSTIFLDCVLQVWYAHRQLPFRSVGYHNRNREARRDKDCAWTKAKEYSEYAWARRVSDQSIALSSVGYLHKSDTKKF